MVSGDKCVICGDDIGIRVHYFRDGLMDTSGELGVCGLCMDYIVALDLEIGYYEEDREVGRSIRDTHEWYEELYKGSGLGETIKDMPELGARTLEAVEQLNLDDVEPEASNLRERPKEVVAFNKAWCEYEGMDCEDVEIPENFMMGSYLGDISIYFGDLDYTIKKGIVTAEDVEGGVITNMDELELFKNYGTYYKSRDRVEIYNPGELFDIKSPQEVEEELSLNVVGQDEAKKVLSTEVYKHTLRYKADFEGLETRKSNILMTGNTGTGKTYMLQTLSKILDIPLVIVDATTFTEAGYVGEDVSSIIHELYERSGRNKEKTEWGMVYIDEIDKITAVEDNRRDVGGKGVQQSLLRLIEGDTVEVGVSSVPLGGGEGVEIDTSNILFIAGGAFSGIEDIVRSRVSTKSGIGFGKNTASKTCDGDIDYRSQIKVEDLVEYGMMKEFVGRFPTLINLHDLDEGDLVDILVESRNSIISSYSNIFKCMGKEIHFAEGSLEAIAREAIKTKSGARSLHKVVDNVLNPAIYEVSSKSEDVVVVNPDLSLRYDYKVAEDVEMVQ